MASLTLILAVMRTKEEIGKGLAERLKLAREHAGLSHAKLSVAAGVSEYHLIKLEKGNETGGGAGLWTVEAIADVLAVSPAWLAFGERCAAPPWLKYQERKRQKDGGE